MNKERFAFIHNPDLSNEAVIQTFIRCISTGRFLAISLGPNYPCSAYRSLLSVLSLVSTMPCFHYKGINYYIHPSFHAFITVEDKRFKPYILSASKAYSIFLKR